MKNNTRNTILATIIVLALAITFGVTRGLVVGITAYFLFNFAISISPVGGLRYGHRLFNPTLILPILTGKVFEAFKPDPSAVPDLGQLSTDWGKPENGFIQPVKFGQEVISQLAIVPNVVRTSPGGLLTASQSASSLAVDLSVTIDRMAAVKVRLPSTDVQQLLVNQVFQQSLVEAGQAIARFMAYDAIRYANSGRNFTNTVTNANPDLDTLDQVRQLLNTNKAGTPRNGWGTTAFLGKIAADPRVQLQYGYAQRIGNNPFASFKNLYGLENLTEIQDFPAGNRPMGTFSADHTVAGGTFTIASLVASTDPGLNIDPSIDFANGIRVQVSSVGGAVPENLDPAAYYYIINYTPDVNNGVLGGSGIGGTFQLSATLGGAVFAVGDNGTGTLHITEAENLEFLAAEKRAIHVASRPMIDPSEAARKLGIPQTMLIQSMQNPYNGPSFLAFMWQDTNGTAGVNPTLDIFVTFVAQYGIRAGRGISLRPTVSLDPTTAAANSGFDRCAVRVITA